MKQIQITLKYVYGYKMFIPMLTLNCVNVQICLQIIKLVYTYLD